MLHRFHAKRLINKGISLNTDNVREFETRINSSLMEKGSCIVAFIGSPGSGKSTLARRFRKEGFLSYPKESIFVIDDLFGPDGERYRRKDLLKLMRVKDKKLFLLFDFRAAKYFPRADIVILLMVAEKERLQNLQRRSSWGYKKYKKGFYSIPPIPFSINESNIYICFQDCLEMFSNEPNESMH